MLALPSAVARISYCLTVHSTDVFGDELLTTASNLRTLEPVCDDFCGDQTHYWRHVAHRLFSISTSAQQYRLDHAWQTVSVLKFGPEIYTGTLEYAIDLSDLRAPRNRRCYRCYLGVPLLLRARNRIGFSIRVNRHDART